jgi:O-acetylserine/cysteine efflux transporter
MSRRDFVLALMVVTIWGANFTVIKLGLPGVPSLLLAALRFLIVAATATFFVKRPKIELRYLVAFGLTVGVGQFGFLFYAMEVGMPAGIASVVLQTQPFFTFLFAALFLREAFKAKQLAGLCVMAVGLILIGGLYKAGGIASVPIGALIMTLIAAAFWGLSNIVTRFAVAKAASRGEKLDMLGLVVWSSFVPPVPLLAMAMWIDSPQIIWQAVLHMKVISIFSALYLAFLATLFGYGVWTMLFTKYPTATVAPLSLLVPITGLLASSLVLGEKLTGMQWLGGGIILLGLMVTNLQLPSKVFRRKA